MYDDKNMRAAFEREENREFDFQCKVSNQLIKWTAAKMASGQNLARTEESKRRECTMSRRCLFFLLETSFCWGGYVQVCCDKIPFCYKKI